MSELLDLSKCILCPRECGVNRTAGELGFCGTPAAIRAARAALMYYEEPCISGTAGSGAVFFTGCNLGCVFCQNAAISRGLRGTAGKSVPESPSSGISSACIAPVEENLFPLRS